MSNISDWFAWDCEGFKNQFVPFQGIMGTKNGNLWCQKPKKKGLYSQFQTSAAPLKDSKNLTILIGFLDKVKLHAICLVSPSL